MAKFKTFAVLSAAAATMAVGIMPANAAATYTVSAGSAASGATVNITGATQGASPQITFKDVTSGTTLGCTSGSAPGTVVVGSGQGGAGIGKIKGAGTGWVGCTGPLGIALQPKGTGTWNINVQKYVKATGVSTGTITGAKATVTGSGCKFSVKGSVPVTYTNSTQILSVKNTTAGLTVSAVNGCFGAVNNGDKASFQADYLLTASPAANNPIKITKP